MIFLVQHILAFPKNNSSKFLYVNKVQSLSFISIYIHFALEKEIGKIALRSILNWDLNQGIFAVVCKTIWLKTTISRSIAHVKISKFYVFEAYTSTSILNYYLIFENVSNSKQRLYHFVPIFLNGLGRINKKLLSH